MPISDEEFDAQYGTLARHPVGRGAGRTYGWGDRFGAAVDSAQSSLYGVGEALGLNTREARSANQYEADYVRNRAIDDTGAPRRLSDIDGVGSFAKGVGGLLVDSSPQLATSVAAGMVAGPVAGLGTLGRLGTAAVAGYPFNYGDVLQSQREEAGVTSPGTAAALAIPYTAADMVGLDGLAATGKGLRVGKYLDSLQGKTGVASRMAANTGLNSLAEGGSETFQEGMNQLGRMAVNPNQTFFNPEANERYGESFAGGALLGGAVSAPLGSWRRSEAGQREIELQRQAKQLEQDRTPLDVLTPADEPAPPAYSPEDYAANYGAPYNPMQPGGLAPPRAQLDPNYVGFGMEDPEAFSESTSPYDVTRPAARPLADDQAPAFPYETQYQDLPGVINVGPSGPSLPSSSSTAVGGIDEGRTLRDPDTFAPAIGGNAAATEQDNTALQDPGTLLAMQQANEKWQKARLEQQARAEGQKEAQAQAMRMQELGLDPKDGKHQMFYRSVETALKNEVITEEEANKFAGQVKAGVAPGTIIDMDIKPRMREAEKAKKAAEKVQAVREQTIRTATAEHSAGLISVEGLAGVRNAIENGHDGKAALVVARQAEAARKAELKKQAVDEQRLAAAEAAMPAKEPTQPAKPANVKVVETPAAPAKVDVGTTGGGSTSTSQPAASSVAAPTGTAQPAATSQPAPKANNAVAVPAVVKETPADKLKSVNTLAGKLSGKKAVLGNSIDFGMLKMLVEPLDARMHHAIRLYVGVDKDGSRIPPMSAQAAAETAGLAKPGSKNTEVSRIASLLGLNKSIRRRFAVSDAQAGSVAEGDLSIPQDTEAIDSFQLTDESAAIDSTGDKAPIGADEYDADYQAAENEYVDDRAVISTPGGSQGKIDSLRGDIVRDKTYQNLIGKVGADLSQLSDKDLGTLAAVGEIHAGRDINDGPISAIMAEITRRMKVLSVDRSALRAFHRELQDANDAHHRRTRKKEVENEQTDVEDSEGLPEVDARPADEGAGDVRTPTVIVRKKRTIAKPTQFSKAESDAEADTAEAVAGPIKISVNGKEMEFGDAPSALAAMNKKIDTLKTLISCLNGR